MVDAFGIWFEVFTVVMMAVAAIFIILRTRVQSSSELALPSVRAAFLPSAICFLAASVIDLGDDIPSVAPYFALPFVQSIMENGLLALGAVLFAEALYRFLPSALNLETLAQTLRQHEERLEAQEQRQRYLQGVIDNFYGARGPETAVDVEYVLDEAVKAINVDRITLWLYSETAGGYICGSSSSLEHLEKTQMPDVINDVSFPHYFAHLQSGKSLIYSDTAPSSEDPALLAECKDYHGVHARCDLPAWVPGIAKGRITAVSYQSSEPWTNEGISFVRAVGDLVLHEHARRLIQESNRKLSDARAESDAIANYTYNAEMWIAPDGQLVWINPAVERVTGYSVDECLGDPDFPFFLVETDNERMTFQRIIEGALETGSGEGKQVKIRRKDGTNAWLSVSWQRLNVEESSMQGTRLSFQDISRQKLFESNLSEAEQRLRTTDMHLRAFFDTTSDAVIQFDAETNIIDWNRGAEVIFGWSREQSISQSVSFVFPSEKRPEIVKWTLEHFDIGSYTRSILDNIHMDGREITCIWRTTFIRDENGTTVSAFSIISDITEQLQSRRNVEEERNKFRDFSTAASDFFFELDADLRISFASDRLFEILNFDPVQLIGMPFLDLLSLDATAQNWELVQSSISNNEAFRDALVKQRMRDGRTMMLSINGIPVFDEKGGFTGYRGTGRDVTSDVRQSQLEDLIRVSVTPMIGVDYFSALVRSLATELKLDWVLAGEVEPHDWNRVRIISGFGPEGEMVPFSAEVLNTPVAVALEQGFCFFEKGICAQFPGDEVLTRNKIEGYASIGLTNESGEAIGFITLMSLSELSDPNLLRSVLSLFGLRASAEIMRRRAESEREGLLEQLLHSQRMETMGALAGGIAHDFNNILTPILGYAEMLTQSLDDGSPDHADAVAIQNGAKRARSLIRQILDFSRRGDFQESGPIDVVALVHNAARFISTAQNANINFTTTIDDDIPYLIGDPMKFDQVLMNLLTNASQAIGQGPGNIEIRVEKVSIDYAYMQQEKYASGAPIVSISVIDDGCGISQEIQSSIFEPFFTTKGSGGGTGFGLSTVKGIIEAMGGSVEVHSTVGVGSNFKIVVPTIISRSDEFDTRDIREISDFSIAARLFSGELNVLYVDDEAENIRYAERLFRKMGHTFAGFQDSRKAFEAILAAPFEFDCLVTDDDMKGMSGLELSTAVLTVNPNMPIVVVSGKDTPELRERYKGLGIEWYVAKPYVEEEMRKAIREASQKSMRRIIDGL